MIEILAEGPQPRQRWRIRLDADAEYILGRNPDADLPVTWDPHVSRRHARLSMIANGVQVEKLPTAANPLFFEGRQIESFTAKGGEHFVIGATRFHIVAVDAESPSPRAQPVEELTFDRQQLQKVPFRDADKRIEVLTHLPEVIWGARTDTELHHRLVNLILAGVAHADAAAIVKLKDKTPTDPQRGTDTQRETDTDSGTDPQFETGSQSGVAVLHWDRRRETAGEFRPSGRLVAEALRKRRRSVLHVWESHELAARDGDSSENYTAVAGFDWAFCTPVLEPSSDPWGLYVAGTLDRPPTEAGSAGSYGPQLQADVKFTELVAEIISTVQRLNRLERQRAGYRQFFAPPILAALGDDLIANPHGGTNPQCGTDVLEPRECDVTVLFCDLRGFSQQAEESADDLIGMLNRVSRALEVMTHQIHEHGGVTGDFQGDAALGFWGWPFASKESPLSACRAALGIRAAFASTHDQKGHPLADFEVGIGIAHGRAVAGKIGTREQVKVTVFGPVVNLASRLESMTKQLRVPILLDEQAAEIVRDRLDPQRGRIRRLARILPFGLETPVVVSELLPPAGEHPELTDEHIAQYELGVDRFLAGHWDEAYDHLHCMPASDRAQDFLTMLIAQHNRVAPPDWDGVVRLPSK